MNEDDSGIQIWNRNFQTLRGQLILSSYSGFKRISPARQSCRVDISTLFRAHTVLSNLHIVCKVKFPSQKNDDVTHHQIAEDADFARCALRAKLTPIATRGQHVVSGSKVKCLSIGGPRFKPLLGGQAGLQLTMVSTRAATQVRSF